MIFGNRRKRRSLAIRSVLQRYYENGERSDDMIVSSGAAVHPDGQAAWIPDILKRSAIHEEDFRIFWAFTDPSETIIDVGANYGYSAVSIWAAGAKTPILAFEPFQPYRDCLDAIANAKPDKYDYRMLALGENEAELNFVMPVVNGTGVSALTSAGPKPNLEQLAKAIETHLDKHMRISGRVQVRLYEFKSRSTTLDRVLAEGQFNVPTERIGAIKIDTEGFELHVVRGAAETLARHKPLVMVEIGGGTPAVSAYMETLGYAYAERQEDRLVCRDVVSTVPNGFYFHRDLEAEYRGRGLLMDA